MLLEAAAGLPAAQLLLVGDGPHRAGDPGAGGEPGARRAAGLHGRRQPPGSAALPGGDGLPGGAVADDRALERAVWAHPGRGVPVRGAGRGVALRIDPRGDRRHGRRRPRGRRQGVAGSAGGAAGRCGPAGSAGDGGADAGAGRVHMGARGRTAAGAVRGGARTPGHGSGSRADGQGGDRA